ncbi:hypothetical protein K443DRAFT_91551, partial [Laccaria amethystina LaAM-08-1]
NPSQFYCVEIMCAPCGLVIAWTKLDKAESSTNILNWLETTVYPTEESPPVCICIDTCLVLQNAIANGSWDQIWKNTTHLIVDSYHYINHFKTDDICCKWCNLAPLNGSEPNLAVSAVDKVGLSNACEQLNAWLDGFDSILKRMTPTISIKSPDLYWKSHDSQRYICL